MPQDLPRFFDDFIHKVRLQDDQKKAAVKSAKALIEKLEGLVSKLEKS